MSDYVPTVDPPHDLMSDPTTITLSVTTSASGEQYTFHVIVDGDHVATNRTLPADDSEAVRTLAKEYLSLFERGGLPLVKQATLDDIGTSLFDLWLGNVWEKVDDALSSTVPRHFVIASDDAAVLNLPWSLLRVPGEDDPIGLDPNTSVRLHPSTNALADSDGNGRPGPLRVLYSACAPRDLGTLGYEREEYQLLQTFSQRGERVAHFGCDLGSFKEFQERLREYRPHVVHLTGHGAVMDGEGQFAFEDERGEADLRRGSSIVKDALANRGVQCVFVSGCQTGQAPNVRAVNGICQGLVASRIPMAVGWAASILDDVATTFANTFYAEISAGETVDRAVVQARRESQRLCSERTKDPTVVDASWTLPVLYTSTTQAGLFDPAKAKEEPPKPTVEQRPLPGMTEGHADYFIGRRREQQRVLPDLKKGALNTVLLTGMGGVGKSTLATRLTRILEKDGYTPIAVPSTEDKPLTVAGLLDRCCEVFLDVDLDNVYERLRNDNIDLRDRLRQLVRALNQNRFVLVLDNLEVNLDRQSREILNDDLAWFLPYLINNLTGSSRCLITSRYRPAELDGDLPKIATELSLSDFPESSFFKYLLDDDTVEQRYLSGDLRRDLLSTVYTLLGGTPRFLEQVRESLADMPSDELREALDTVNLPEDDEDLSEDEKNELREIREQYIEDLFIRDLYHAIEPEASRDALCCAAVYTIPMTTEGYAAAAGVDEADVQNWIQEWQRRTLVTLVDYDQQNDNQYWVVPTVCRHSISNKISDKLINKAKLRSGEYINILNTSSNLTSTYLSHEAVRLFMGCSRPDRAATVVDSTAEYLRKRGLIKDIMSLCLPILNVEQCSLSAFWMARASQSAGNFKEAADWAQKAIDYESNNNNRVLSAYSIKALCTFKQGNYADGLAYAEAFRELMNEEGYEKGYAAATANLGSMRYELGDWDLALKYFREAIPLLEQSDDLESLSAVLVQAARVLGAKGDLSGAVNCLNRALKNTKDKNTKLLAKSQLAMLLQKLGVLVKPIEVYYELLDEYKSLGSHTGVAAMLHRIGLLLKDSDSNEAKEHFLKSASIEGEVGNLRGMVSSLHEVAYIDMEMGNYEEAETRFKKVLQITTSVGPMTTMSNALHNLGCLYYFTKRNRLSLHYFMRALSLRQNNQYKSIIPNTFMFLAALAGNRFNAKDEGLVLYATASSLYAKNGDGREVQLSVQRMLEMGGPTLDEDSIYNIIITATEIYEEARGWSLIQKAFPGVDIREYAPPSSGETRSGSAVDL